MVHFLNTRLINIHNARFSALFEVLLYLCIFLYVIAMIQWNHLSISESCFCLPVRFQMEDVRGSGLQPLTAEENTDGFNCHQIMANIGLTGHYSCTHTGTLQRVTVFHLKRFF